MHPHAAHKRILRPHWCLHGAAKALSAEPGPLRTERERGLQLTTSFHIFNSIPDFSAQNAFPDLNKVLDGQNRQSPIASVQRMQPTLASHAAVPRGTNTTPTNTNRAIRIAAQRTKGLRGPNSVFFRGRYDCQRTLVI